MTREEIVALVEKLEFGYGGPGAGYEGISIEQIEKFADLIAKAERAKCVKAIEDEVHNWDYDYKEMALELAGMIEELK